MDLNINKNENKIIHLKIEEKNKRRKERILLNKIFLLPNEIITIIYSYIRENVKYLYYNKYCFLDENIKNDKKNGFIYWKFLRTIFDTMENEKILNYINKNIISQYPLILENIWYSSRENNKLYRGIELLTLWKNNNIDINYYKENREIFNNIMKFRFVDALYYYIIKFINIYEYNKKMCIKTIYSNFNILQNIHYEIYKIHYLCKSLSLFEKKLIY